MLGYELFSAYPGISCFTTTRFGGCSGGAYASFNCSPFCGDDDGQVRLNQQHIYQAFPGQINQLVIPRQVHGTEIAFVDKAFLSLSPSDRQRHLNGIDALITTEPGYCVCVSTADCVPLLIYDHKHQAVAAVHAGWRGTVDGILAKTLLVMNQTLGTVGGDVLIAIGPSISVESFEVGQEVYDAFEQKGFNMSRVSSWEETSQKYHIDLWEANREQMRSFGVPEKQMACAGICTYLRHEEFFSARRLGIKSGRILSGIVISS